MDNETLEDMIIERAATIEYDGGMPRDVAEKMACAQFGVEWVDTKSDE